MLVGEESKSLGEPFLNEAYISFCSEIAMAVEESKSGVGVVAGVNGHAGAQEVLGLLWERFLTIGVTVATAFFSCLLYTSDAADE